MHPVENLTHLYRARYFWHTPSLDLAMRDLFSEFGDKGVFPPELYSDGFGYDFFGSVFSQASPCGECSRIFYEPCDVVKNTAMEVIVISKDMPSKIMDLYPDFHKGGKFHINKAKLQRDGKALHTRHGDYFYIDVPDVAISLESKELLEVAS
jgi:hypothetical protein